MVCGEALHSLLYRIYAGVPATSSSAMRMHSTSGAITNAACGFESDSIRIFRKGSVALTEFVLMMVHDVATGL